MRGKPGASPGTHSDRRRCALTGLTRVNFPHPFLDGTPTTDDFRRPTRATAIVPMFVGRVHSRRLARSNHRTQASALVLLPGQGEPGGEPPRHGPPRGAGGTRVNPVQRIKRPWPRPPLWLTRIRVCITVY